jgi:hypothetical protein
MYMKYFLWNSDWYKELAIENKTWKCFHPLMKQDEYKPNDVILLINCNSHDHFLSCHKTYKLKPSFGNINEWLHKILQSIMTQNGCMFELL